VVNSINLNGKIVKVTWPVEIGGPFVDTLFKMGLIKENKLHGDFIGELSYDGKGGTATSFDVCVISFSLGSLLGDLLDELIIIITNINTFRLSIDELAPGAIIRSRFIPPKILPPNLKEKDLINSAFRMAKISLPDNVINKMIETRKSKPSNELVLYIKQTGEVVSADLEGSFEIMVMP
jgi:hypothetical protein